MLSKPIVLYGMGPRQVLEHLGDYADYISLHRYVGNDTNNTLEYLSISTAIDRQIEEMDSVCRYVQAKRKSKKRTYLCFDEWNVWYKNKKTNGSSEFAPHLIEEIYNLEDALVVAEFLNSFIRHADSVKIANIAQIVNVIAPILTRDDDLLIQSIFYPFEMICRRRSGIALKVVTDGPSYDSISYAKTNYLDSSAILDDRNLHVFVVNRSMDQPVPLRFCIEDSSIVSFSSGLILGSGADPKAENSFDNPDKVVARPFEEVEIVA